MPRPMPCPAPVTTATCALLLLHSGHCDAPRDRKTASRRCACAQNAGSAALAICVMPSGFEASALARDPAFRGLQRFEL